MKSMVPSAAIVVIGDEILSGQTLDINVNFIAKHLQDKGIIVGEVRIVPDDRHKIMTAIKDIKDLYTYVFTTGGIGPTHDDITTEVIAQLFSVPVICDSKAVVALQGDDPAYVLSDSQLKMAHVPRGASLIKNTVTRAPGYIIENVYVMAGVPHIMQAMFMEILPTFQQGQIIFKRSVIGHVSEGKVAKDLTCIQQMFSDTNIGSYPHYHADNERTLQIVIKGYDEDRVIAATAEVQKLFDGLII